MTVKELLFLFLFVSFGQKTLAQGKISVEGMFETEKINQLDPKGKRQGPWLFTIKARMGEPARKEFGNYEQGYKNGLWYQLDAEGELLAIENYRNNILDGEVRYFDQGKLFCIGHYRGLNPHQDFDTIVVVNPESMEEKYHVLSTEKGSLRHGSWKYFSSENGNLIREEIYQVDNLVFKKDYDYSGSDSVFRKQYELKLPHFQKKHYAPPAGKSTSLIK